MRQLAMASVTVVGGIRVILFLRTASTLLTAPGRGVDQHAGFPPCRGALPPLISRTGLLSPPRLD
jgi:hypothetical protein